MTDRSEKFEKDFRNIESLGTEIDKHLHEVLDIISKREEASVPAEKGIDSAVFYSASTLLYALVVVYSDLLYLAKTNSHISTALLSRALVEGMSNAGWLCEKEISNDERIRRASLFIEQAEEIYDLTNGKVDKVIPISAKGAGTITGRLSKYFGGGWKIIYSHLCSYSHMDGGYNVHYHLKESQGARNLFSTMSTVAVLNSVYCLSELLNLDTKKLTGFKKKFLKMTKMPAIFSF